jgi:hypothetical protein
VVRKEHEMIAWEVGELERDLKNLNPSHVAPQKIYGKLKDEYIELSEKYENLECTFNAINIRDSSFS